MPVLFGPGDWLAADGDCGVLVCIPIAVQPLTMAAIAAPTSPNVIIRSVDF
jgi:hypothetical protein